MRTTASYDLFPDAPGERVLAKARYLAREGRVDDALAAYRRAIGEKPELKSSWTEAFDLLRRHHRSQEALELAEGAVRQFPEQAFALTLQGAALIELERYRDALVPLEAAVERDPDLALIWHELGRAAWRLGDRTRALMALDRAFSLEPHAETLRIRGKVLREAGRYQAAEVAFEGAAQAAEHDEQRDESNHEIHATRRYALFAPRRPDKLSRGERFFAETGAVVLADQPAKRAPNDSALVEAFAVLARDRGWRFGQLVVAGEPTAALEDLAQQLGVATAAPDALDPTQIPLVVHARPTLEDAAWARLIETLERGGAGLALAVAHDAPAGSRPLADVVGALVDRGRRLTLATDAAHILVQAQHPSARVAGRRLHT